MFTGVFVALVTPFTSKGKIDKGAMERQIEWLIHCGIDGIVCLGTTGETPTLTSFEKTEIISFCIKTVNHRVPVVVGTGTNCTQTTIENTEIAKKLGANAVLVITPYYNRPTEEGCFEHFRALSFPTILYHHPPRTGVCLTAKAIVKISELNSIVGIKEGPSNITLIREIRKHTNIPIFSGDDHSNLSVLKEGGVGVISAAANVIPQPLKNMVSFALKQKWNEAQAISDSILPLISSLFKEVNPQGIKYALSVLCGCSAKLRLPMMEVKEDTKQEIRKELNVLFKKHPEYNFQSALHKN